MLKSFFYYGKAIIVPLKYDCDYKISVLSSRKKSGKVGTFISFTIYPRQKKLDKLDRVGKRRIK